MTGCISIWGFRSVANLWSAHHNQSPLSYRITIPRYLSMEPWNKPDRPDVIHEFITLCKVRAGGFMPRKSIDRYLWMVTIDKAGLDYEYVLSHNILIFLVTILRIKIIKKHIKFVMFYLFIIVL